MPCGGSGGVGGIASWRKPWTAGPGAAGRAAAFGVPLPAPPLQALSTSSARPLVTPAAQERKRPPTLLTLGRFRMLRSSVPGRVGASAARKDVTLLTGASDSKPPVRLVVGGRRFTVSSSVPASCFMAFLSVPPRAGRASLL